MTVGWGELAKLNIFSSRMPLGFVPHPNLQPCVVPDRADGQRGSFFLPFADAEPKTSEVISKILLLANDHKIKDPSILAQIERAGG